MCYNPYNKNLTPLTYKNNFFKQDLYILNLVRISNKGSKYETTWIWSKEKMSNKTNMLYPAICTTFTKLIHLYSLSELQQKMFLMTDISNQNITNHAVNLGSKLTNHKMPKFLKGPQFVHSLCSKLCMFTLNSVVGLFNTKKSLTSFVLNKHLHWFSFLHFDPVQVILLLWALHRFSLLSFMFWVIGL